MVVKGWPTYQQLQTFLQVHQIRRGTGITFKQHSAIMDVFKSIYGKVAFAALMDCWEPWGEAVEPGYEDSLQFYCFSGITRSEWDSE